MSERDFYAPGDEYTGNHPDAPIQRPEERLAQRFHELYEDLAPAYGYKTREASAVPWEEVPEQNKRLMIAVCKEILSGEGIRIG